jgi:hypothetical protein
MNYQILVFFTIDPLSTKTIVGKMSIGKVLCLILGPEHRKLTISFAITIANQSPTQFLYQNSFS